MPCYDPETHLKPIRLEGQIHYLTDLLCSTCKELEKNNVEILIENSKLSEWWENHKRHDQEIARIKEKRRVHGPQSLTGEELGYIWDEKL
jgi:hypothetical protein